VPCSSETKIRKRLACHLVGGRPIAIQWLVRVG
jgi:hypothetical protein